MEVHIVHFYPDLMNLYGSYANVVMLERYLKELGCSVTVEKILPGESRSKLRGDFFYMGAGTEHSERAAMEDLARYGEMLKEQAYEGEVLLFAGTAMELLGRWIKEPDGTRYRGIGLADFCTEHLDHRRVGDVYGHTDLYPEAVVGFMNKSARIRDVELPLLYDVELGWGNEGQHSAEGFHWKNVFASQLTGPLLVKNPRMLEQIAATLYARQGRKLPEERLRDPVVWEAYRATERELKKRAALSRLCLHRKY